MTGGRAPADAKARALALTLLGAFALVAGALVTGVSCAPKVELDIENPSPFDEDDPAAFGSEAVPQNRVPATVPTQPETCRRRGSRGPRQRTLSVTSAKMRAVLDAGPGVILSALEVKPTFAQRRFTGWEIIRFMPCETRFDGIDIRPGDVIGRVNGRELARPEHLADLWAQLRWVQTVLIEVKRQSGDFYLRFEVTGDAKPAGP